jgi:hypothetical protein
MSTGGDEIEILYYSVELLCYSEFVQVCQTNEVSCKVSMEELLSSPFNLLQGEEIRAVVTAVNIEGFGPTSELSSLIVAEVQDKPYKPVNTV